MENKILQEKYLLAMYILALNPVSLGATLHAVISTNYL